MITLATAVATTDGPVSIGLILAVIVLIIDLAVFIGGAVWVVARVNSQTGILQVSIDHLTKSIDNLANRVGSQGETLQQHSERIAVLEVNNKGAD